MEARPMVIDKEHILDLQLVTDDVLTDEKERDRRNNDLYQGMILGNLYKSKVQIVFQTLNGIKRVHASIWATTDKNVVLKGGIMIPVACVMQVIM